ncbi:hypothetical protein PFICI_15172 [Pestalotiopsis fici W106-1]|uniref:CHRD domain-containing protein n=1 Tax=Pestalotiopsis fici (strain W106-1 / CGMCC3.15140) TaxID=1229662 RepID=W3WJC7_PESFW|nr:uncharacterized protein PFICI_15172 [Pestalotiopsis fici W106-1]ETS73227.1 hypothetical protein PFICI_15172 [Pestalotiopsis fici W106-1]
MKASIVLPAAAVLASNVMAAPAFGPGFFGHGFGGFGGFGGGHGHGPWGAFNWGGVNWKTFDYSKVDWSSVDWSQIPYFKINWNKVNWPYKGWGQWQSADAAFTSTYSIAAWPQEVIGTDGNPSGGLAGARGVFNYGLISSTNTICWNIVLTGFQGEYQSPAKTATHIHEAQRGENGPPRIAFPNPVPFDPLQPLGKRISVGCATGPFTTGIKDADGFDTGYGFTVDQIENDPSSFFTDVHSSYAVPGACRGQFE